MKVSRLEDEHGGQSYGLDGAGERGVRRARGAGVALYVKKHFVATLTANESYLRKDYKKALYETFLKMGVLLGSAQELKGESGGVHGQRGAADGDRAVRGQLRGQSQHPAQRQGMFRRPSRCRRTARTARRAETRQGGGTVLRQVKDAST